MTTWQRHLDAQDGVIARWQALEGGLSARQWRWRLQHAWTLLLPGVAVAHTGEPSPRECAWAAVLHAGKGAALSGDAALGMHGLSMRGAQGLASKPRWDVVVPTVRTVRDSALRNGQRLVCHRVPDPALWRSHGCGLPLINAHAAVLHASAWAATDRAAEYRLAAVVQQGISAVPLIRRALAQMPKIARRSLINAVLDDVELGAHAASELQFLRFLRAHGLPLPDELQTKVRVGKVHYLDARYLRQRLIVEVDGAHHRLAGQWEADALRSLRLAAHGGDQVIRITTAMMRHDAEELAALLSVLLSL